MTYGTRAREGLILLALPQIAGIFLIFTNSRAIGLKAPESHAP